MPDREDFISDWVNRPRTWKLWKWAWPFQAITVLGLVSFSGIIFGALNYPNGLPDGAEWIALWIVGPLVAMGAMTIALLIGFIS